MRPACSTAAAALLPAGTMTNLALIQQIGGWWDDLTLAKQVFYGIGIVAGFISLVLAVLTFAGMDHHDAPDVGDAGDLGGSAVFSVKPLTGFFLGFGWAGGMALDAGWTLVTALVIALVVGSVLMGIVLWMIRAIYRMRSDGTMQVEKAVGAIGTVYITIPPRKAAGGQVIVNFSGRQETFGALTAAEATIASGEKVRVLSLVDRRTVLVEPL